MTIAFAGCKRALIDVGIAFAVCRRVFSFTFHHRAEVVPAADGTLRCPLSYSHLHHKHGHRPTSTQNVYGIKNAPAKYRTYTVSKTHLKNTVCIRYQKRICKTQNVYGIKNAPANHKNVMSSKTHLQNTENVWDQIRTCKKQNVHGIKNSRVIALVIRCSR